MTSSTNDTELRKQRQVIFWRLLAATFGATDEARNIEKTTGEIVKALDMPPMILDPSLAVETLLQRYPELKPDFDALQSVLEKPADDKPMSPPAPVEDSFTPQHARRWLAYSKLLLNVFGPNTLTATVNAEQFNQWRQDVARFEACLGFAPSSTAQRSWSYPASPVLLGCQPPMTPNRSLAGREAARDQDGFAAGVAALYSVHPPVWSAAGR